MRCNCMDSLPSVISCCFCCFLRAGTVMISLFSFMVGLFFAPNVNHAPGIWDMKLLFSNYSLGTETAVQLTLGIVSIILCIVSVLLLVGALCNMPVLIEIYQWGALVYSATVVLIFLVMAVLCFFVHVNAVAAGITFMVLIAIDILLTAYFVIVANSLRVSMKILTASELML